jgi:transcriptional regulator with XRE-family HTH domain
MYRGPLSTGHAASWMDDVSSPSEEKFGEQLRRVREDRGLSRDRLARLTARAPTDTHDGYPGLSTDAITKLEREPDRRPQDETIRALGEALDADTAEFPSYGLAVARQWFDERPPPVGVGRDQALENLRLIDRALRLLEDVEENEAAHALQTPVRSVQGDDGTPPAESGQ